MKNLKFCWTAVFFVLYLSGCAGSGYNRYADDFFNQGVAWYQNGQYERAVDEFTKVLEMAPRGRENYIVYYNRGLAYYKLRDYDRAISDFDAGLQLLANLDVPGKPETKMKDANIEPVPSTPKIEYGIFNLYKARGDAWFYKKGFVEAISDYDNALKNGEQRTELPTVYTSLGWAMFELDDYKGAINSFSIAIDMDPHKAEAFYGRARARSEIGEMDLALKDALVAHDLNLDSEIYDKFVFEVRKKMKP